jgi:hypothetical protein
VANGNGFRRKLEIAVIAVGLTLLWMSWATRIQITDSVVLSQEEHRRSQAAIMVELRRIERQVQEIKQNLQEARRGR